MQPENMTNASDATLEWFIKRERALHYEFKMYGFVSQFAVDFILSGIKKSEQKIIQLNNEENLMNEGMGQIKQYGSKQDYKQGKKDFNKRIASINIARESLDNCSVILERMNDYIIENGKNYKQKETA